MNYIDLINHFWQCNSERPIGDSGTTLYFYLLNICNSLHWKNPFKHSDRHIAANLGMSVNTVRSAKNKLSQLGLIKIETPKKPSRGIDGVTSYTLTVSKNDTVPYTVPDTVPYTVPDTVPYTVPDTLNKLNQTKPNQTKPFSCEKSEVKNQDLKIDNSIEYVEVEVLDFKDLNKPKKGIGGRPKTQFGTDVRITTEEYQKLLHEFGKDATDQMIDILDNYKASTGKKYKDDYRAILSWVVKRYNEDQRKNGKTTNNLSQKARNAESIINAMYSEERSC